MTALTENDWKQVQSALERMECVEIERIYAPLGLRVIVSTSPTKGPWAVAMVITVKGFFKGGVWHKHCESVEQAKRVIRKWNG